MRDGQGLAPEAPTKPPAVARDLKPTRLLLWAALGAAAVVALWLRFYRLSDPIAGFHVYNEGFYGVLSAKDAARGVFEWFTNPIDLNNPPLYSLVVTALFRLFGVRIEFARAVSAAAGIATVALVWDVGRILYSRRTATIAALVLALMPGAILVSRQAQTDALQVALSMGAVACYLRAMKADDIRWSIAGGAVFGLALLTKLPAVLVLPGLIVVEWVAAGGITWLRKRCVWAFAAAAAAVIAPWYVARLVFSAGALQASQEAIASVAAMPSLQMLRLFFLSEPYWMLGTAAAVLVVGGLVVMAWQRRRGDLLVAVELATVLVFLVPYHFHAYYWLPATPWLALVAARALDPLRIFGRWVVPIVTGLVLVSMVLSSSMMLYAHKWGQWSVASLEPLVRDRTSGVQIAVPESVYGNLGPAIDFHLPAGAVLREGEKVNPDTKRVLLLDAVGGASGSGTLYRMGLTPVFGGVAFGQDPASPNFFINGAWHLNRIGPPWQFGVVEQRELTPYTLTDVTDKVIKK